LHRRTSRALDETLAYVPVDAGPSEAALVWPGR